MINPALLAKIGYQSSCLLVSSAQLHCCSLQQLWLASSDLGVKQWQSFKRKWMQLMQLVPECFACRTPKKA